MASIILETERFNAVIRKLVKNADADAGEILREMHFHLKGQVISRTPVDTGRARAGWRTGKFQLRGSRPFIDLVNLVPYIVPLEYGWSRQAPKGMLRISLQELRKKVSSYVSKFLKKNVERK